MKRIYLFLLAIVLILPTMGQERIRIAIFDPTSSGDNIKESTKIAIRETISSTIVNLGKYDIAERALLEKVMQEQKFSLSGAVNDNQAAEIGKLTGANKIIVSVATVVDEKIMFTLKMIDVNTANVEKQQLKTVTHTRELLHSIEAMTRKLLGENVGTSDEDAQTVSDEIEFYLAPASFPDYPVSIYFDEEFVGSGSLSEGFDIKIEDPSLNKDKEETTNKKKKADKKNKHKLIIKVLNTITVADNDVNGNVNGNTQGTGISFGGISIGSFFKQSIKGNRDVTKTETTKFEFDLDKARFYEFQVRPKTYYRLTVYSVELKKHL